MIYIMPIWIKVFIHGEQCCRGLRVCPVGLDYGDLDECLSPAGTKLRSSGSKALYMGNQLMQSRIFVLGI